MHLIFTFIHTICSHWPMHRGRDLLMRCFLEGAFGEYLAKLGPWIATRDGWEMKANMGKDYSSQMLKMFGELEPMTKSFLLKHVGGRGVFLDVGANVGYFSLLIANHQPDTKVIAFEPNSSIAAHLADSIKRANLQDRLTLHMLAASDSAGMVEFLIEDANSGHSRMSGHSSIDRETLKVETICLDEWLPERLDNQVLRAVKIDVEGAELLVLRGMKQLISAHKPALVVEAYDEHLKEFGDSLASLRLWLNEVGYVEESYVDGNLYLIHENIASK